MPKSRTTSKARTTFSEEDVTFLAEKAAELFLAKVLTYGELHEQIGAECSQVADVIAAGPMRDLFKDNDADRRRAAWEVAAFRVGLAIGRRIGGVR